MLPLLAILKKLVQFSVLLLLVTFATFVLSSLIPGDFFTTHQLDPGVSTDAIEQLRHRYDLDQPIHIQYARWLRSFVRLDLGHSLFYGTPVADVVAGAIRNTLWMGIPALILGMAGGILLGSLHAACRDRRLGRLLDFLSSIALSLPSLVLGLAALLFASRTHWFPLGSMSSLAGQEMNAVGWLLDRVRHLVLPVACLTVPILASVERIQWGAARDAFDELFIRSARARGLSHSRIFLHYVVRPSLNPVLSTSGPILGSVLSGSLVLEIIFAWPGLGQITYNALFSRDLFLLVGCVVASAALLIAGNIAADLALISFDPRIRRSSRGADL